ncbi:MAG: MFS transporter [archaeon]|nr:MFS transporter [archaeon]
MSEEENKDLRESNESINKVSFGQKAAFGWSIAGLTFISSTIDSAMLTFYTVFIGFSITTYGIVQLLFAIINAINDPIIGYFSDRSKPVEGKGKRKIWIMRSIPVIGVGYFLMIVVYPGLSPSIIFIILFLGLALHDTGNAANQINRGALMISITDDDNERASMVTINLIFQTILGIVSYLLILIFFTDVNTPLMTIYAVLIFVGVFGVVVTYYGTKKMNDPVKLYEGETFPDFKKLMKDVLKSKTFIFYILFQFVMGAVTTTLITFQAFYFRDVIGISGAPLALVSAITFPFSFIAYFLVQFINKRLGPRRTLLLFIFTSIMSFLGLLLISHLIVALVCYTIINMGNAAFWILSSPIFGNVIDEYELKTGDRNVGTFNGINAIFITPNKQIMIFIFTQILAFMNYQQPLIDEVTGEKTYIPQGSDAILGIKIAVALVPIILLTLGFIILLFFPLRGEKLKKVKKEMKKIYDKRLS